MIVPEHYACGRAGLLTCGYLDSVAFCEGVRSPGRRGLAERHLAGRPVLLTYKNSGDHSGCRRVFLTQ